MNVDTRYLRAFLALAEELHFGAAAQRLNMAQPPLSQQIRRLEEQLGARLFERTTRSVRLTKAGQLLLTRARFAMNQIEDGVRLARLAAAGVTDRLSVGFIQPALYQGLPAVVRAFTEHHPGVVLQLEHLSSPSQIEALLEGRLDVGLIRPPPGIGDLQIRVIAREGFAVALPRGHRLAQVRQIPLASLAGERFIHFRSSTGDTFPQQVPIYCRRAGFEPRFVCETTTTVATLTLVAIGSAIAILPRWTRHIAPADVVLRPVPELPAIVELAVACLAHSPSNAVHGFLSILGRSGVARQRVGKANRSVRSDHAL